MSTLQDKQSLDINNLSEENKTESDSALGTSLEKLGYNKWFEGKSKEYLKDHLSISRIV